MIKQPGVKKNIFWVLILLCSLSCAHTVPLKITPRGYLDQKDYEIMQSEAEKLKLGRSKKIQFSPVWSYWAKEGKDFSKVNSISLPDFKLIAPNANETEIKKMLDETADILLGKNAKEDSSNRPHTDYGLENRENKSSANKKIFDIVDRTGNTETEISLIGAVMEYKCISKGERFKTAMIGGMSESYCIVEIQMIDNKTHEKIGAIQINSTAAITGVFFGLGALASGKSEEGVKKFLVTIMEEIKMNKPIGSFHPMAKKGKDVKQST